MLISELLWLQGGGETINNLTSNLPKTRSELFFDCNDFVFQLYDYCPMLQFEISICSQWSIYGAKYEILYLYMYICIKLLFFFYTYISIHFQSRYVSYLFIGLPPLFWKIRILRWYSRLTGCLIHLHVVLIYNIVENRSSSAAIRSESFLGT